MTALSSYTERMQVLLRRLLVLCLLLNASFLFAQTDKQKQKVHHDSSAVQLREPEKSSQDDVFADDYWRYDRDKTLTKDEPNVFDRIWNSFMESLLDSLQSDRDDSFNFWNLFWILLLVALVVFVILRVTKTGTSSLFSGKKKTAEKVDATLEDVNIHAIDYDRMIEDAARRKDYRLAVRLWFLRTLKVLSDKELLEWKVNKTNSDYYYEMSGSTFQKEFGDVSFVYDYIWYGEKAVDENSYREAEGKFQSLYVKIENL